MQGKSFTAILKLRVIYDMKLERVHYTLMAILALLIVGSFWTEYGYNAGYNARGEGIAFVGDINNTEAGNQVLEAIDEIDHDFVILVGDLCYQHDCSMLIKYKAMFGDRLKCILGNHDLLQFVRDLCGQPWSLANDNLLLIGLNSQDNLNKQYKFVEKTIRNSNATDIVILTHEPCINSNDNMHPEGIYQFCDKLTELQIRLFIAGHHHIMGVVENDGITYFTVGTGGSFLQKCNKDVFTFCKSQFGFLLMEYPKFTFYNMDNEPVYEVDRK